MKLFATKNQNKKEDKHPDFRLYYKDEQGNVIEEEYDKKDGTKGKAWKTFGAMWHNVENGKIKSSFIDIDLEALNALNGTNTKESTEKPAQEQSDGTESLPDEDVNPEDIPF